MNTSASQGSLAYLKTAESLAERTEARDAIEEKAMYYEDSQARIRLAQLKTDDGLKRALESPTLKLSLSPPGTASKYGSPPSSQSNGANRTSSSPPSRLSRQENNLGRDIMTRFRRQARTHRPEIVTSLDIQSESTE